MALDSLLQALYNLLTQVANSHKFKKNMFKFKNQPCQKLWSHLGSNQGPPDYESGALTN